MRHLQEHKESAPSAVRSRPLGRSRLLSAGLALATVVLGSALVVPDASAKRFLRGTADPLYFANDGTRSHWFDETVRANSQIARLNLVWRWVAQGRPANPSDPADPAYNFASYDAAVREASSRGLRVLITISNAPDYAEGDGQPSNPPDHAPDGSFAPKVAEFAAFGAAVARRYSGTFSDSAGMLPRVGYLEAWNEPNISAHLNPQWKGRKNASADHYRKMLNAFYSAVKRESSQVKVVSAGLAPFGDDPPDAIRTRPLRFMRELFCLRGRKKLKPGRCRNAPKFDIFAHHPINLNGGPREDSRHPDDVAAVKDMKHVRRTLRAAERAGNAKPRGRHEIWITEFWWETDPPDPRWGFKLGKQARWIQEGMYLAWKYGVSATILLQLVDDVKPPGEDPRLRLHSGLFFNDGREKPSFRAFSFPFASERKSRKKVIAWTVPPQSGKLRIEKKRGKKWRTIEREKVRESRPEKMKLRLRGSARLRAKVGGEQSLAHKRR